MLKLCLLKEIWFKLSYNNIINKLPKFFSFIMQNIENINIKYIDHSKEEIQRVLNKNEKMNIINFSDFIEETLKLNK